MIRDANRVPTVGAVTNNAALTPVDVLVNPATNGLLIDATLSSASTSFDHGAKSGIGATALAITAVDFPCYFGVIVKALAANPDNLYIGSATVTPGTADATDGVFLEPGRPVTIEVSNPNLLYAIADGAGPNKLYWVAI